MRALGVESAYGITDRVDEQTALAAPAAHAAPTIPDNLPMFPQVDEHPNVTVTFEDGTPATGATVHRGDVLLVHGSGFDPGANRGGFPLPVPPGTPNGVYVLYSGFGDNWKPSSGSDGAARKHPHDRMAWVAPAGTIDAIPSMPVDMRRSIARVSQPMAGDGSFTARIVVDPPEQTPGGNYGVYVYAAAGSVNPAEEFYVPIAYSSAPGPNTPAPAKPDLVLGADVVYRATDSAGGGVNPRFGAGKSGQDVTFTRDTRADAATGTDTIAHYTGTVTASARFNVVEMSMKDPWIENRGGTQVLTALVSTGVNVGTDEMRRMDIGTLTAPGADGGQAVRVGPTTIGDVHVNG